MNIAIHIAEPWWVNFFILIPPIAFYSWRKQGLAIANRTLVATCMFGMAFGFIEAAVVIYLRAATGLLPGYGGTLSEVAKLSSGIYQSALLLGQLPESLLTVEILREAATIIVLLSVAWLAINTTQERCALFLWVFATWDIFYYIGLWATIGWPPSLLTPDVLFLIPVPWFAQVWFPILVSAMTLAVVLFSKHTGAQIRRVYGRRSLGGPG